MKKEKFRKLSTAIATWTGTPAGTTWAIGVVVVWFVVGIPFRFNDSYLLGLNLFLSVVTYVMLFFIQASQNRDARVMSLKSDAILAALDKASNRLIDLQSEPDEIIEEISEEIRALRDEQ